jgi:hypothetical protein
MRTSEYPASRSVVVWATNTAYPSRVHMANGRGSVSLCGFPVGALTPRRPERLAVCPDCAMVYVDLIFPVHLGNSDPPPSLEWFRQLSGDEQNGLSAE